MQQGTLPLMVTPRVLLFLQRAGRFLFIEGAAYKWWAGKLNGIGGSMEPEETVLDAALRETLEETGLEALNLQLAAVVTVISEPPVLLFVFLGELAEGELQATSEGIFHWLTAEEAEQTELPIFEDFPFMWERLEAWRAGDPPRYLVFDYRDGFTGREYGHESV